MSHQVAGKGRDSKVENTSENLADCRDFVINQNMWPTNQKVQTQAMDHLLQMQTTLLKKIKGIYLVQPPMHLTFILLER